MCRVSLSLQTTFSQVRPIVRCPLHPEVRFHRAILLTTQFPAALLVHHSILDLSASPDSALRSLSLANPSSLSLSSDSATRLRAASIVACSAVVSRARELAAESGKDWLASWTEQELDGWLWNAGKREGLRDVERIAEKATVYY